LAVIVLHGAPLLDGAAGLGGVDLGDVVAELASRKSAYSCMSAAWPMQMPQASWIISWLLGIITTSSRRTAMKLAAEAAMPSTIAVTLASWLAQGVEDRQAVPDRAAAGVDPELDLGDVGLERVEGLGELVGGDAPVAAPLSM
jgi:hypothetical protein